MKAALRWAHNQEMIARVPKIVMPKKTKGAARARIQKAGRISTEDFEHIMQIAPSVEWKIFLAFAWHCGMRRSEAMAVRGEHIHLDQHLVDIPHNKAKDAAATAFITPELDAVLRDAYPDGLPQGNLTSGGIQLSKHNISRHFTQFAKTANVKGNGKEGYCTIHDLRRNFGSRWATKVPAQILQRMMRHSHISVTMEYYADVEQAAIASIWNDQPRQA